MKFSFWLTLLSLILLAAPGTTDAADSKGKKSEKHAKWFAQYSKWPMVTTFHLSTTHWEQDIRTFVSSPKLVAIFKQNFDMEQLELDGADMDEIEDEGGYQQYPVGAVLAKENFRKSPKGKRVLDTVSFMEKTADSTWRYISLGADGAVKLDSDKNPSLATSECVVCHAAVDYRDYIYHTFFDTPAK